MIIEENNNSKDEIEKNNKEFDDIKSENDKLKNERRKDLEKHSY